MTKEIWYFDKTDMQRAKETVGRHNCLMGNVPTDLLYAGSVANLNAYCINLIEVAGRDGGFIISNGAGMQGARAENVRAMIECGKTYGIYGQGPNRSPIIKRRKAYCLRNGRSKTPEWA